MTTPDNADHDADLDAAALVRAFITRDHDAVPAILAHADPLALCVALADFAASVITTGCGGDEAKAVAMVADYQRGLATGAGS